MHICLQFQEFTPILQDAIKKSKQSTKYFTFFFHRFRSVLILRRLFLSLGRAIYRNVEGLSSKYYGDILMTLLLLLAGTFSAVKIEQSVASTVVFSDLYK